ncbi:MAG: NrsF family protein [Bryobacteraceae bacterium]
MTRDPLDELFAAPTVAPDPKRLERIERLVTVSLKPVRPLPSDTALMAIFFALFAVFAIAATLPFGFSGFDLLDPWQRFSMYGVISICAFFFAATVAGQMIPGSRRKHDPWRVILRSLLYLAAITLVVFQNFDRARFVARGIPCLRLGSICAAIAAACLYAVIRNGFVTSMFQAGAVTGAFAGLAGIAVLALHCPIHSAAHVLAWHLSVMLLAALGGAIFGWSKTRAPA